MFLRWRGSPGNVMSLKNLVPYPQPYASIPEKNQLKEDAHKMNQMVLVSGLGYEEGNQFNKPKQDTQVIGAAKWIEMQSKQKQQSPKQQQLHKQ